MADSLDSGSSVHYARAGSSPASRTKMCRQKRYTAETPHRSAVFLLFGKVLEETSAKKFIFTNRSKLFQERALGVMQNPVFRGVSVSNSPAFVQGIQEEKSSRLLASEYLKPTGTKKYLSVSPAVLEAAEGAAGPDLHAHEALQPEGCSLWQCVRFGKGL